MEREGSLPYSQAPATCPYPEPTPSSPHNPFPLPQDPLWRSNTHLSETARAIRILSFHTLCCHLTRVAVFILSIT